MRTTLLLLLLVPAAAGAQTTAPGPTMYKCLDAKGGITYSNITCEKQGLKQSGTVTSDRVTSMPFTEPPKSAVKGAPKPPAAEPIDPKDEVDVPRKGPRIKPVSPVLEKLVK